MIKKLYILSLSIILSQSLFAEIGIIKTINVNSGCDGSVYIQAEGTSGPFTIDIYNADHDFIDNAYGINGIQVFYNLCEGDYYALVYSDHFCDQTVDFKINKSICSINITTVDIVNVSRCGTQECSTLPLCTNDGEINIVVENPTKYSYQWSGPSFTSNSQSISGLAKGQYWLTITDISDSRCREYFQYTLGACQYRVEGRDQDGYSYCYWRSAIPDPVITVTEKMFPSDGLSNGFIKIDLNLEKDYTLVWKYNGTTISNDKDIYGLAAGDYTVEIDNGCSVVSETITLSNCDDDPIRFDIDNFAGCAPSGDGRLSLENITGGNPPYKVMWSTGDNNVYAVQGLNSGNYSVTVTDANKCSSSRTVYVNNNNYLPIIAMTKDGVCPNHLGLYTADDLVISGGYPPYSVVPSQAGVPYSNNTTKFEITDAKGCTIEHYLSPDELNYYYDISYTVTKNFTQDYSNAYEAEIELTIHENFGPFDIFVNDIFVKNDVIQDYPTTISIPAILLDQQPLTVTIRDQNGCSFDKEMEIIPVCEFQDSEEYFTFSVTPLTTSTNCTDYYNYHSYKLDAFVLSTFGTNDIKVYLSDTPQPNWDNDLVKHISYNNEPEIIIDNIGPGYVTIIGDGGCRREVMYGGYNCESDVSDSGICEILDQNGDNWELPFLSVVRKNACYDECDIGEPLGIGACSEIDFYFNSSNKPYSLTWSGTIKLIFPDDHVEEIVVVNNEATNGFNKFTWEPHDEGGEYEIKVGYYDEGSQSLYPSCDIPLNIEFYSPQYSNYIVGYQTSPFINNKYDEPWKNAYAYSFIGKVCRSIENNEVLNNSGEIIDEFNTELFYFEPNDPNNPCNGGGYINTFHNENGVAKYSNRFYVPPGSSIMQDHIHDYYINFNPKSKCENYGNCLFDSGKVFGQSVGDQLGGPIMVTYCLGEIEEYCDYYCRRGIYLDECDCGLTDPFEVSCDDVQCFGDEECVNGACVKIPVNGACEEGYVLDETNGICVLDLNNCPDDCPTCYQGDCLELACGYSWGTRSGGSFKSDLLYHGMAAGDIIRMSFTTYKYPDGVIIKGPISGELVRESILAGKGEPYVEEIILENSKPLSFEILATSGSQWDIKFECIPQSGFTGKIQSRDSDNPDYKINQSKQTSFLVIPNPFKNKFTVSSKSDIGMVDYKVYNAYGGLITTRQLEFSDNNNRQMIDLSGQPSGVYFLSLSHQGKVENHKIVKI